MSLDVDARVQGIPGEVLGGSDLPDRRNLDAGPCQIPRSENMANPKNQTASTAMRNAPCDIHSFHDGTHRLAHVELQGVGPDLLTDDLCDLVLCWLLVFRNLEPLEEGRAWLHSVPSLLCPVPGWRLKLCQVLRLQLQHDQQKVSSWSPQQARGALNAPIQA